MQAHHNSVLETLSSNLVISIEFPSKVFVQENLLLYRLCVNYIWGLCGSLTVVFHLFRFWPLYFGFKEGKKADSDRSISISAGICILIKFVPKVRHAADFRACDVLVVFASLSFLPFIREVLHWVIVIVLRYSTQLSLGQCVSWQFGFLVTPGCCNSTLVVFYPQNEFYLLHMDSSH